MMPSGFEHLIPGLPTGARIVRIGLAGQNDYELYGSKIVKGPRSGSQVIVAPVAGYEFAFDIASNSYSPRVLGGGPKTATVTFDISDPAHAAFVKGISQHPSVIKSEVPVTPPTAAQAVGNSQVKIVEEPKQIEAGDHQ